MANTAIHLPHDQNAKRFAYMYDTFNRICDTYVRTVPRNQSPENYPQPVGGEDYLITHLKHWIHSYEMRSFLTRSQSHLHDSIPYTDDGRRPIPSTIRTAIDSLHAPVAPWKASKVCVTWIVCYIHNILPDTTKVGWETFDCSHLCINQPMAQYDLFCISAECLYWESKAVNQSRGNPYCCRQCTHCNERVCVCQKFHNPPCV
jgi:hypothetical protein